MGLLLYFISLYFQPNIHGDSENLSYTKKIMLIYKNLEKALLNFVSKENHSSDLNLVFQITFFFFLLCGIYTYSFLPYGRFYNRLGGNAGMLGAYIFFFSYLVFTSFRKPHVAELHESSVIEISKELIAK
jgi:hypothetical protein